MSNAKKKWYNIDMEDKDEKVYIFVSHSHKDINKVRLVRNYLEDRGAEPILFFLKSVTDDNEVEDLIKREIDARLWFLYCRSRNAEKSNWVKTELEYIKSTGKKNCLEIDLDKIKGVPQGDVAVKLDTCVKDLKKLNRVFVSYSLVDRQLAEKLIRAFEKYGIKVLLYGAEDAYAVNFYQSIETALNRAAEEDGLSVCLISSDSLRSKYCETEMKEIIKRPGKKIIAWLYNRKEGDTKEIPIAALPLYIRDYNIVPVDCSDIDAAIVTLMNKSLSLFGDYFLGYP